MQIECHSDSYGFQGLSRREVVARFDGGAITSDAGGLLLREVENRSGIIARFARGFVDHRENQRTPTSCNILTCVLLYPLIQFDSYYFLPHRIGGDRGPGLPE